MLRQKRQVARVFVKPGIASTHTKGPEVCDEHDEWKQINNAAVHTAHARAPVQSALGMCLCLPLVVILPLSLVFSE